MLTCNVWCWILYWLFNSCSLLLSWTSSWLAAWSCDVSRAFCDANSSTSTFFSRSLCRTDDSYKNSVKKKICSTHQIIDLKKWSLHAIKSEKRKTLSKIVKLDESTIEVWLVIKWRSKNGFLGESFENVHLNHVFKAFVILSNTIEYWIDGCFFSVGFDNKCSEENNKKWCQTDVWDVQLRSRLCIDLKWVTQEMKCTIFARIKKAKKEKRIALVKYFDSGWFGSVIFELVSLSFRLGFKKKKMLLDLKYGWVLVIYVDNDFVAQ